MTNIYILNYIIRVSHTLYWTQIYSYKWKLPCWSYIYVTHFSLYYFSLILRLVFLHVLSYWHFQPSRGIFSEISTTLLLKQVLSITTGRIVGPSIPSTALPHILSKVTHTGSLTYLIILSWKLDSHRVLRSISMIRSHTFMTGDQTWYRVPLLRIRRKVASWLPVRYQWS